MIDVAVHAAIADQAEEVQAAARFRRAREGLFEHFVGRQFAVGDRLGDARQILIDDASGAQVQVADFRVAHLAVWQAHVRAARAEPAVRIGGQEVFVERGAAEDGRVAVAFCVAR